MAMARISSLDQQRKVPWAGTASVHDQRPYRCCTHTHDLQACCPFPVVPSLVYQLALTTGDSGRPLHCALPLLSPLQCTVPTDTPSHLPQPLLGTALCSPKGHHFLSRPGDTTQLSLTHRMPAAPVYTSQWGSELGATASLPLLGKLWAQVQGPGPSPTRPGIDRPSLAPPPCVSQTLVPPNQTRPSAQWPAGSWAPCWAHTAILGAHTAERRVRATPWLGLLLWPPRRGTKAMLWVTVPSDHAVGDGAIDWP